MSDTIEQSTPVPASSEVHPAVEGMLERIARDGGDRAPAIQAFARALTRRLTADDVAELGPDALQALVTSAFAFADERAHEPWVVRVFHPDPGRDGYATPGSVIEITTDDSPFLVDSVSEELLARELTIHRLLHPVVGTVRDQAGGLVDVRSGREAEHRESFMHIEVDRVLSEDAERELEGKVRSILRDVALVVRDFEPMKARVREMQELARGASVRYPEDEVEEVAGFLEWLLELNFVLLGYREYELLDTDEGRAIHA
ncbi:MAG TPA: hypothetical protein VF108_06575, partial [Actinomycetota bacterium]